MTSRLAVTRIVRGDLEAARGDVLVVPVREGALAEALKPLEKALASVLGRRAKDAGFRGATDEVVVHHGDRRAVVLVGLGTAAAGLDGWRRVGGIGRREAERLAARRTAVWVGNGGDPSAAAALAEGFLLAGYRFDRYRSEARPPRTEALAIVGPDLPRPREGTALVDGVRAVVEGVYTARDLVNEPPSVATPRFLADRAAQLASASPLLAAEIWDGQRIAREGLVGVQAVARGSAEDPRFIILRYAPADPVRRVALIGKGITFDSGGLSLKPPKAMETMKYDMAGAAAVLGAVSAAAGLGLPLEVTAYVAACENLPGGRAQKPGDVLRYANGRTVEVLNTDAEGRLVLADGLLVAARSRPDAMVDVATLTGAARVALGNLYAAVLGTDQPLVDRLIAAGQAVGEPCWQLPLVREYREDMRSAVADVKNVGGPDAGTIIGALFLAEFCSGIPWAHLDIAGPAYAEKDLPLAPRGGTGYGVRLLVRWLQDLAAGRG